MKTKEKEDLTILQITRAEFPSVAYVFEEQIQDLEEKLKNLKSNM
ncbi:hypothetical protein [Orenia marismortui]|nr:hypothetical protein [Orenia marismortui]